MAELILGVTKLAVETVLNKAKSVIEAEQNLEQSVQRDLGFINEEFLVMQCFLKATSDDYLGNNELASTWVQQVRDAAGSLPA